MPSGIGRGDGDRRAISLRRPELGVKPHAISVCHPELENNCSRPCFRPPRPCFRPRVPVSGPGIGE